MSDSTAWWQFDGNRLSDDTRSIKDAFPDLDPLDEGAGIGWKGVLPLWPFARTAPTEFRSDVSGLEIVVLFPQSYPMTIPDLYPINPMPELSERTQHRWHVNGDGSLCMVQAQRAWTGRESVVDLLVKAAGWRLEYGLVKACLVEDMTENGIVSSTQRDTQIAEFYGEPSQ